MVVGPETAFMSKGLICLMEVNRAAELEALPLGRRDGRLRDLLKKEGQTPLDLPSEVRAFLR